MTLKAKAVFITLLMALCAVAAGCSYGGVAAVNENTVVVLKNNAFLFGIFNEVYVCKVSDGGLTSCATNHSP